MASGKELDYLFVLKALREVPFCIGRKLLIDFLRGNDSNESIQKNKLFRLENFGSMAYDKDELEEMIDSLLLNDMIRLTSVNTNRFWKVMELTPKGIAEIDSPSLYKRKISYNYKETETLVSDAERQVFAAFDTFLSRYNDAQKKAIVSKAKEMLCIAGAGSGKTTVLTKRIEFLVRFKSVDPSRILAITFTRKARQEMMSRLAAAGGMELVMVETFNSFCEKMLRQHNDLVYDKPVRVISYRDKLMIVNKALISMQLTVNRAINIYFTQAQQRSKTQEQLANIFMNDCFFIRDYFKFKNKPVELSSFEVLDLENGKMVKLVIGVCRYIEKYMQEHGLRDFADQLLDTMKLFRMRPELIPQFTHVLVDEYQDVNSTQVALLDMLTPENIFCVGDPRQSIYGWRGSDVRYILNFEDKYPECEIVTLTENYRSTRHIVELINLSIKNMRLADLESSVDGAKDIRLLGFGSEDAEFEFVIQRILAADVPPNETFVLARTNRQLNDLSSIMKLRGIQHIVRSDELKRSVVAGPNDVTLATVHAIKGLEAKMVFVIGCNGMNFPCKGSEHPIMEMVKVEEYDKEEEERRLFYVAMSRARESLYLTYTGKRPTGFVTKEMYDALEERKLEIEPAEPDVKFNVRKGMAGELLNRLKEWRRGISKEHGVPAFMVLHDRTLLDIVHRMPMTKEELNEVHGLGPAKVMKYGEQILQVVNGV